MFGIRTRSSSSMSISNNSKHDNTTTPFIHSTKNNSSVLRFARGPDGTRGFQLKRSVV